MSSDFLVGNPRCEKCSGHHPVSYDCTRKDILGVERMSSDLVKRLRAECVGYPAALIKWPHRILHEAAARIEALEGEVERFRKEVFDAVKHAKKLEAELSAAEARAERLEGEVASLTRDYADLASRTQDAETRAERLRGILSYLKVQAENGTLHSQVVIQNARKALEDDKPIRAAAGEEGK